MDNKENIANDDEINLLDLLIVLAKRKKLILQITLGAAIITAIISLIMPPIYKAETKILPPQQSSGAAQMLSQLGAMAGIAGGSIGIKNTSDTYIALLKSRTVADRIIDRFDLMKLYKAKYRDDARKSLANVLSAQDDKKSGIITVGIEDKDPKRAAEMANAFIEELKNLNKGLAITEAAQRRLFFEEQLKDVKQSLVKAEESMTGFQEKTGALRVEEQAKAVIEGIANLRATIAAKEVQLKVMKTYATPHNPDFQRTEEELRGLREQLSRLEGRGSSHNPDTLMPTGRMPSVDREYIRKLRDLKFNETLYELLLKQYEAAKLDEARDATVIQIVEKAIPPEKRAKPKRRQMVIIAMITAFFFSIFVAFIMEYKERASKNPENRERVDALKRYITFKREKK